MVGTDSCKLSSTSVSCCGTHKHVYMRAHVRTRTHTHTHTHNESKCFFFLFLKLDMMANAYNLGTMDAEAGRSHEVEASLGNIVVTG